jgi:hypothetical protein
VNISSEGNSTRKISPAQEQSQRERELRERSLLRARQQSARELAVLVAVDFTADRYRPSAVG